jgi:hypothetical protein
MTRDGENGGTADEMRKPTADEQVALDALKRIPHPEVPPEARERARAAFLLEETSPGSS